MHGFQVWFNVSLLCEVLVTQRTFELFSHVAVHVQLEPVFASVAFVAKFAAERKVFRMLLRNVRSKQCLALSLVRAVGTF